MSKLREYVNLVSGQDLFANDFNNNSIGVPYITGASNFENDTITINRWTETPKSIAYKGDLLLTVKGTVGKMAFLDEKSAHIARQIMAIRPTKAIDGLYLKYLLSNCINTIKSKAKGLIPGIERKDILGFELSDLPPINEQRRIAVEIERQLAAVEKAKQAAMEQLEAAQALNAAYLQEVFEGNKWDIVKLGDVCLTKSGKSLSDEVLGNNGIPYIKVDDLNRNSKYITNVRQYYIGAYENFAANTIIFPKRGGAISTNKKRIAKSPICADLNIMGITPNECLDIEYFYFYFLTVDLGKLYTGSSIPQINNKDIEPLQIPLPPLDEQYCVAERLEAQFAKTEKIKTVIQTQLDTINVVPAAILREAFSEKI